MEAKKRRQRLYLFISLALVLVFYIYFLKFLTFSPLESKHTPSSGYRLKYTDRPIICVLVLACNRASVERCIDSIFKYRSLEKSTDFPLIVSQDCGSHPETTNVIKSYGEKLLHIYQPNLGEIKNEVDGTKLGYYKQTRHHAWALKYVFDTLRCPNVITLEDDLEVAPDFFEYFAATLPILRDDSSLYCVTASNLQAKNGKVDETAPELLHRTDYFFGWGWMTTRKIFHRLGPWPAVYWDTWMGLPNIRENRSCIRPEIPRIYNFGRDGTSGHKFYDYYVQNLSVNVKFVPFTSMDLSYLYKKNYDKKMFQRIKESHLIEDVRKFMTDVDVYPSNATFSVVYNTPSEYKLLTKLFGIHGQTWNGISHTMYQGIVTFMYKTRRIYLVPGPNWRGYEYFTQFDNMY